MWWTGHGSCDHPVNLAILDVELTIIGYIFADARFIFAGDCC